MIVYHILIMWLSSNVEKLYNKKHGSFFFDTSWISAWIVGWTAKGIYIRQLNILVISPLLLYNQGRWAEIF